MNNYIVFSDNLSDAAVLEQFRSSLLDFKERHGNWQVEILAVCLISDNH